MPVTFNIKFLSFKKILYKLTTFYLYDKVGIYLIFLRKQ